MTQQIKAIIFDLDGTLINTIDSYESIFLKLCKISKSNGTKEDFHRLIGMPNKEALKHLLKKRKINFRAIFYIIFNSKKLKHQVRENASLYPNATKTLEALSKAYRLAIVTSSKRTSFDYFNEKFRIAKNIEVVITQNDVKQKKPYPEPYLKAAEQLGLSPEECLAIEDAPSGSISANKAGMKTIIILNTARRELFQGESTPTDFISGFSQLTEHYISSFS